MILVTEMLATPGPALLAESGWQVRNDPTLWNAPERLRELLPEARALIVRNQTRVTAQLLETAPNLRVIGRLGVGLDNIDLAATRSSSRNRIAAERAALRNPNCDDTRSCPDHDSGRPPGRHNLSARRRRSSSRQTHRADPGWPGNQNSYGGQPGRARSLALRNRFNGT